MILVTGATGLIGRRLVAVLASQADLQVRVLLRPGADADRLPRNVPLHVMMGEFSDPDSLLAAMDGVHTIFHLIGTDTRGRHANLEVVDVPSVRSVVEAAQAARVGRVICISRIGADRASAFPILRAKGEIEDIVRGSGLSYTIFRTSVLFGQGDRFTENIAMLIHAFPLFFVPGDGESTFQPLWVNDLVTCMAMSLEDLDLVDSVVALGGPEVLTYRRIILRIMHTIKSGRPIVGVPLLVLQSAGWFLDGLFARWPFTEQWIELLATNQTADLGTVERHFGFRPSALDVGSLEQYMKARSYFLAFLRYIFTSKW